MRLSAACGEGNLRGTDENVADQVSSS
jgi:hypothetical protein